MAYTQAEEDIGAVVSVQIDAEGTFDIVPQTPALLEVNLNFLQYHATGYGGFRVDNPRNDVVYFVTLQGQNIVVEPVPIAQE